MKYTIRTLFIALSLCLLASAHGADTNSLPAAASDRVSARPELIINTIGFDSCARQERPQERTNLAATNQKMFKELSTALRQHIQHGGATPWQKPAPGFSR